MQILFSTVILCTYYIVMPVFLFVVVVFVVVVEFHILDGELFLDVIMFLSFLLIV
jgi:hypothetical protein